ncbi:MAG: dihydrofolate reductase [Patescibacteria group bacterium]
MINIIAAIGKNLELGKDNKLLWHIAEDFKRFKKITEGHIVIMGRKTYESLPEKFRPLPNRVNIVVTRDLNFTILKRSSKDGNFKAIVCNSIEEAIKKAKSYKLQVTSFEVFIIGGASIYKQGIKYADKLYLTLVNQEFPGADAFFPDYSDFKIVKEEKHQDEKYSYKFIELIK